MQEEGVMKICYLVPGIGLSDGEKSRRQGILNAIAAPGTEVEVRTVADGPRSIENAVDEYKAMPHVLAFIMGHQADYDAFIIGCAGDTGLEGAREQSKKPVVGPGESTLLLGTVGDKRFSMITISDERARLKRRMVREAGLAEHRLVSSHSVGIPVLELYKDPRRTQSVLIAMLKDARAKGAETMLLGCMSIAFMEPALLAEASDAAGIPLINPIVSAVKMAEALAAIHAYGRREAPSIAA
jgi:allantoin racemase